MYSYGDLCIAMEGYVEPWEGYVEPWEGYV